MTSSLVGSEMCIRDSKPTPSNTSQNKGKQSAKGIPHPDAGATPQTPDKPCLLYTSDAADDM
eukprot:279845-Prorocentrum_lima.AAC.1